MKIIVCFKQVPDTAIKVKIDSNQKKVDKTDLDYVANPYDEIALEHAIRLKKQIDDVEIILLSLGSENTEKTMRRGLAMGADRGILLHTEEEIIDPFLIAKNLSETIKEENPDLILTGIKAVDNDNAQVGAMIASLLEIAFINTVVKFELNENKIQTLSEVRNGQLKLESSLPCVLGIEKSDIEITICSFSKIRKAKKKKIDKKAIKFEESGFEIKKIEIPKERRGGKIVGEGPEAVDKLFQLLKEEAKVL